MVETSTSAGRAAFTAALAAVVVGLSVLVGWFFDLNSLKRVVPGLVAMNPATAIAFVFAGLSLALFLRPPRGRNWTARTGLVTARIGASAVALIGLAKIVAVLAGWENGVDRWLFASKLSEGLQLPNRMALNTALSFILLGSALLVVDVPHRSVRLGVELSAVLIGLGSLVAILAYAYDLELQHGLGVFVRMALPTAITFLVLMAAILLAHTDDGLLAVFAGDSAAGKVARYLLPAAVLVPAALGLVFLVPVAYVALDLTRAGRKEVIALFGAYQMGLLVAACDVAGREDHRVTVRVANGDGRVRISVKDNGIGIPPENLTRIFSHGFTTRPGGHGFGLHSSALAARELGGSLTVRSDGPGQGAFFTLELPWSDAGGLA